MTDPFRGSESGLTRQQLRAAKYARLHRDVYVLTPAVISLGLRVDAARRALPDAIPSHATAARLLGLPADNDGLIHVTRPRGAPLSERPGLRTHRGTLRDDDLVMVDGRTVTSPERTFLDLASTIAEVDLVILADAVVRMVGLERVARRLAPVRTRRVRGIRRARAAVALADPLSDSPAETKTRLILHNAGFTALRHGVDVSDAAGGWLARPDLADEEAKVALQYDGLVHLGGDPEQRRADIDRDELLRQHGWQVVVLTAVDLRAPHRMVGKVAAAYDRAVESRATPR